MFLRNIATYLEQEFNADLAKKDDKARAEYLDSEEAKARCEVIDYFRFSEGVCAGVSVLWGYGKLIADDPTTDKSKATDDIEFFRRVHNLISQWDQYSPFTEQEKKDINTFVMNILHYQRSDLDLITGSGIHDRPFTTFSQEDLSELMEDTKRGRPQQTYRLNQCIATQTMLRDHLKKVISPGVMIFVTLDIHTGGKHQVAVYQNEHDKLIYYFDINNDEEQIGYEVVVKDVSELTRHIFSSASPRRFGSMGMDRLHSLKLITCNVGMSIHEFSSVKKPIVYDDTMRISDDEFHKLLETYPTLFSSSVNLITNKILESLTSEQVMRLLKNPATAPGLQKTLLDMVIKVPDRYSIQLNRYILRHHYDAITPNYMSSISARAAEHIDFDSVLSAKMSSEEFAVAKKLFAMNWLNEFDNGRIDDIDIQLLTISDALFLASHRPGDKVFLDRLLTGCNKSHKFEGLNEHAMFGNVMKAVQANVDAGHLSLAKEIISFIYETIGLIPSTSAIAGVGSLDIASYIHKIAPHMEASKYAAIEIAIENDDVEKLKSLLAHYKININDELNDGQRLTHLAINNLSLNVISFLEKSGADFTLTNKYDDSALSTFNDTCSFALQRHGYEKLSQAGNLLYQYHPVREIEIPLLRMAIERDDLEEFKKLLSRFNINDMQFNMGSDATFAHLAARKCSLNILKFLTTQRVDFCAQDKGGDTPLSALINHTMYLNDDKKRAEDRFIAAEMMIAAGALQQQKNPIEDAMRAKWYEMIPFLVKHGVNVNGAPGENPLLWRAATIELYENPNAATLAVNRTMQTLIECGADVNYALECARRNNISMRGRDQIIVDLFESLSEKAAATQQLHSANLEQVVRSQSTLFAKRNVTQTRVTPANISDIASRIDKAIAKLTSGISHPLFGDRRKHKIEVLKIAKKYLNSDCSMELLVKTQSKYPKWNVSRGESNVVKLVNEVLAAKNPNSSDTHKNEVKQKR